MNKKLLYSLVLITLLYGFSAAAQQQSTWYAAARSGLKLREKPDPNAAVVLTIPYGEPVWAGYDETIAGYSLTYTTEGFSGSWWSGEYKGQKGFVFSEFLFPFPPPRAEHKTLSDYIRSFDFIPQYGVYPAAGNGDGSAHVTVYRYVAKNGIGHTVQHAHEYESDIYQMPGFTFERAYHLVRLLPEFAPVLKNHPNFPAADWKEETNDNIYSCTLEKDGNYLRKIHIVLNSEGCSDYLDIYYMGLEVVIERYSAC